jgi:catalase
MTPAKQGINVLDLTHVF